LATGILLALFAAGALALVYTNAQTEQWTIAVTWAVLLAVVFGAYAGDGLFMRKHLSRRGRARRDEWDRVAHELGGADGFERVRVGGVVVWGRVLAYAVGLGLAPRAVSDVPVRPDGPRSTWIDRQGAWTRVEIRYPRRVPLGCGRPPLLVAGVALAVVALAVLVGGGAAIPDADLFGDLELAVVSLALLCGGVGAWTLAHAMGDLIRRPVAFEGVIVARRVDRARLGPWSDLAPRSRWLAVDDGGSSIRAFRVREDYFESFANGYRVQGAATRSLGCVTRLMRVPNESGC
jgi:hypothetical protein